MQSFHYNQRNYLNLVAESISSNFTQNAEAFARLFQHCINPKKNRTYNKRIVISKGTKYNNINC